MQAAWLSSIETWGRSHNRIDRWNRSHSCMTGCGTAGHRNTSAPCYINCVFDMLLGEPNLAADCNAPLRLSGMILDMPSGSIDRGRVVEFADTCQLRHRHRHPLITVDTSVCRVPEAAPRLTLANRLAVHRRTFLVKVFVFKKPHPTRPNV